MEAGKSTLINIILGNLTNYVGNIVKPKDLKISYDFKILENLINLDKQEFENLLDSLLDFQKILYRNVKLKEMNFRYRLWKMHLKGNNLYFISENNYLDKKGKIIINLMNKEKEVIISDID